MIAKIGFDCFILIVLIWVKPIGLKGIVLIF